MGGDAEFIRKHNSLSCVGWVRELFQVGIVLVADERRTEVQHDTIIPPPILFTLPMGNALVRSRVGPLTSWMVESGWAVRDVVAACLSEGQ